MDEKSMVKATACPEVIAKSLKVLGLKTAFGVVGIPVTPIAFAIQKEGIQFIALRSEAPAGYAACGFAYLNWEPFTADSRGCPGVVLTTGGPGFINALAGLSHATANRFPLVLISGSAATTEKGKGAFQELNQTHCVTNNTAMCKACFRCLTVETVHETLTLAFMAATTGIPGGVYVDFPADTLLKSLDTLVSNDILSRGITDIIGNTYPTADLSVSELEKFKELISNANAPLIILGKGAAMARTENRITKFCQTYQLPVLPTPMGRGIVADDSLLCVSSIRSRVLREADIVVLFGARLNWMLHFGEYPKWSKTVQFISIDIDPSISNNEKICLALTGELNRILDQLNNSVETLVLSNEALKWTQSVMMEAQKRKIRVPSTLKPSSNTGMSLVEAMSTIKSTLIQWKQNASTRKITIVAEGSNCMDISRMALPVFQPRGRLDAGSWGTMGVGLAYCIASCLSDPTEDHLVLAIEGDSAIGFSLAELETLTRYNLPAIIIVFNNGGVYTGQKAPHGSPPLPTQLNQNTQYDLIMEAVGGIGTKAYNQLTLVDCLSTVLSMAPRRPSLINLIINSTDIATNTSISHSSMSNAYPHVALNTSLPYASTSPICFTQQESLHTLNEHFPVQTKQNIMNTVFPTFSNVNELSDFAISNNSGSDYRKILEIADCFLSFQTNSNISCADLLENKAFTDTLLSAVDKVGDMDMASLKHFISMLSHVKQYVPGTLLHLQCGIPVLHRMVSRQIQGNPNELIDLLWMMLQAGIQDFSLTQFLMDFIRTNISELTPQSVRDALRSIQVLNIRESSVLSVLFDKLVNSVSTFSSFDVVETIRLAHELTFFPRRCWKVFAELPARHYLLFELSDLIEITRLLCEMRYFSPQYFPDVFQHVLQKADIQPVRDMIEFCFSSTLVGYNGTEQAAALINMLFSREPLSNLNVDSGLKLAYCICHYNFSDMSKQFQEIMENCLAELNAQLTEGNQVDSILSQQHLALLSEILVSAENELNVELKLNPTLRQAIDDYALSTKCDQCFSEIVLRLKDSMPISHQFNFEADAIVGPYRVSFADKTEKVILEGIQPKDPTGVTLRQRHLNRLGYICCRVGTKNVKHAVSHDVGRVEILCQALDRAALLLNRATVHDVQDRKINEKRKAVADRYTTFNMD